MGYPAGLHIFERAGAAPGAPAVVFVHGSLDRGESFRRVMRRLPDLTVVAYDRRGYQDSRAAGVAGLGGHIADLVAILAEVRSHGASPVIAIGHSLGGDIALGAAVAEPRTTEAVGAFEPPMPWLGFRRRQPDGDAPRGWHPLAADPGDEVERFFCRMVSPSSWERLSDAGKKGRRADGPALVADLLSLRGNPPFDVMNLSVPALLGVGGTASAAHHRATVAWLGSHVPAAAVYEIPGAQHGAHLSHPDHFAGLVRAALQRAGTA